MIQIVLSQLFLLINNPAQAHLLKTKRTFLVEFAPGPTWQKQIPYKNQKKVGDHIFYLKNLYHKGYVELGGSRDDNKMGLYILRAKTIDEVRRLLNKDPMVASKKLIYSIKPLYITMKGKSESHIH